MEDDDAKKALVIEELVDTGGFKRCEFHDEVYDVWGDYDAAKTSAHQKRAAGVDGFDRFTSDKEIDELMDKVINSHGDSCSSCDKNAADD